MLIVVVEVNLLEIPDVSVAINTLIKDIRYKLLILEPRNYLIYSALVHVQEVCNFLESLIFKILSWWSCEWLLTNIHSQ